MPTLVNTIDSKELYAARAVADAAGNDIAQTYATKAELPDELTAGSGVEIVNDVVNAKVDGTTVTFDENGRLTATGGGSSVNADWDAVSGPEEILNKPTPKTLTAGANITVTETASTITIGANVPAPTPQVNADWAATSGVAEILNKPTVDQSYDGTSTNAQSGTAVAEGLSTKADVFNVGDGLNLDTTGGTTVVKFDTPTQYTTYTDIVASKAHADVATDFTAVVLGPFVTISGVYDPMLVITITSNVDTLLCTLKDGFKPIKDVYVSNYPGNSSIPYGGLHIAPDGKVYIHQNGTTSSATRYFSVTYMRQMN